MDFKRKVKDELEKEGIDATEHNVVDELFIKKFIELNKPLDEKINNFTRRMSFKNFNSLSKEDQRLFAENFFVDLDTGSKANGKVRIILDEPADIAIPQGTKFTTQDGLEYETIQDYSFTQENVEAQSYGSFYYIEVMVEAIEEGDNYNISENMIRATEDERVLSLSRDIYNPEAIEGGDRPETSIELYNRIQSSIATRTLANPPAINNILRNNFASNIIDIHVTRAGSKDMERDVIQVGDQFYRVGNKSDIWVNTFSAGVGVEKRKFLYEGDQMVYGEKNYKIINLGYSDPFLPEVDKDERHDEDDDGEVVYICEDEDGEKIDKVVTEVISLKINGDKQEHGEDFIFIQEFGHKNSTRQQSFVGFKTDIGFSDEIEIEYATDRIIPQIQSFVIDKKNRFPLGDILVKKFIIYRLYGKIVYRGDIEEQEISKKINEYIRYYEYNPERSYTERYFELSDLISELYGLGVQKVNLDETELKLKDINQKHVADITDEFELENYEIILPGEIFIQKEG